MATQVVDQRERLATERAHSFRVSGHRESDQPLLLLICSNKFRIHDFVVKRDLVIFEGFLSGVFLTTDFAFVEHWQQFRVSVLFCFLNVQIRLRRSLSFGVILSCTLVRIFLLFISFLFLYIAFDFVCFSFL